MRNCKEELKKWNKRTLKRTDQEISRLKEELKKLRDSDLTQEEQEKIQQIKENIAALWKQKEKYWGQRARLKWLKWGDKNTAFFHAKTIQRRGRNRIDKLKNEAGCWIENMKEIMKHIEERFDALFTSNNKRNCDSVVNNIPVRVTEDMDKELSAEVTEEEIRKAVFSMGSLKAPGPDGLNGLFYQKHWEIIKKEVCAVVREFFRNGFLPEEISETIVVLIPKVKDPEELNQLRPISCCNFIYKIITRVIMLRLKGLLEDIVSPTQSAFVGGRLIQDNVVIVQEVYHSLNRKGRDGSENVAIKLDMNKAYDRLEWDFLEKVLKKFGFAEKWVDLVMKCVRSASYRVRVNGELSKKIKPQRGLRQGDPLSPYLLILAAEVFTILMQQAKEKGNITGLKIAPTAPAITHLLFADDCIIFAKAKEEKIFYIITVLNEYTEASGQIINMNKSGISFGSQVPIQTRVDIEDILGMKTWDMAGKYLGLPAIWGRSHNKALAWIEEKIMNKLEGWKERLLNQPGKETLIKSWAASGKERGIHWKKWDSITESKSEGGLGFKDLVKQNTAYLAKQAWRAFKNPNAIWVQILKSLYFPDGNFWTATGKKGASWVWRTILHGRELLRKCAKWSIGDGSKVSIWKDNWIAGRSSPLNTNSTDDSKVNDLIVNGEGWNKRKIESKFSQEICKEILSTPVSVMNKEDHLYWPWKEDGNYSIRTGYYVARRVGQNSKYENLSTSEDKREIWKEVWRMEVPQKIRMFLWKACHDILPIESNLYKRKMAPNPICQICLKSPETVEHALLLCDWARAAWFGAEYQWTPTVETVSSIGNWMVKCIKKLRAGGGEDKEKRISKLGFLMWEIWKTRNNKLFQQQDVNPKWTICMVKALEAIYWKLTEKQHTQKTEGNRSKTNLVKWRPPLENWLKANVDATFRKDTGTGAIVVVIRDHKGRIILGFSGKIQATSSTVAEAQAVRQALIIVNNLQMGRTLIETDNLKLAQAIKSKTALGEAMAIIQDIQILMANLPEKGMTWTPRNGNRLAHAVAKAAEAETLQASWSTKPPTEI
nr:uncharacterized protein LOC112708946 [Arachis hypogaea]